MTRADLNDPETAREMGEELDVAELDDVATPLARSKSLPYTTPRHDQRLSRCNSSSSVSSSSTSSSYTTASLESSGLLRLSLHVRSAVTLNQVRRVEVSDAFDRLADGATVYALDVFLHSGQKGLPSPLRRRHDLLSLKPAHYRLEYRYSELRALRERIRSVITRGRDPMHAKWCTYCSRVAWLVEYGCFPSRVPASAQGRVAACCGIKHLVVRHRRKHLAEFFNRLLRTAKDTSYRCDGHEQCPNFAVVSRLLMHFLAEPSGPSRRASLA
jgi:hypothetical protein